MSGIYWLASYPKSGNTWMRALLTNYLRDADEPADINDLEIGTAAFSRGVFDETLGLESADLTVRQIEFYRPAIYEEMARESGQTLFLKVHDAFSRNAVGQPVFPKSATAGVVYLIRNPLDIAVSYAHHQDETIDSMIDFMNKNDAVLSGSDKPGGQLPQKLSSWSGHVESWTSEPELNVLVVRYEDLIALTVEVFTRIIAFAGLETDNSRVRKAVDFSTFEQLQKQEKRRGFAEKQPTALSFFREGRAGAWREKLSPAQIERIVFDHQKIMRRFGYLTNDGEIVV